MVKILHRNNLVEKGLFCFVVLDGCHHCSLEEMEEAFKVMGVWAEA